MRTNLTVIFFSGILIFGSCTSDRTRIEYHALKIINAIRDSDLTAFEDYMGVANYKKNEENHIFYFNEAHTYIKKYTSGDGFNSLEISPEDAFHITKILMPLFEGFDSSNGLKRAVLILSFGPATPYSRYSKFFDINIDEDLDVEYRHEHPVADTTIPKLELDSAAIKKMTETPLFN
ncbi:MAG: hypothetical protein ACTHJ0_15255 [Flavipsychrobacter sp.]